MPSRTQHLAVASGSPGSSGSSSSSASIAGDGAAARVPLVALVSACSCTAPTMLRAGALVCGACGSPISAPSAALGVSYSQLDGQRPAGVGRVRYLRAWRRARDEHAPADMVWSDGRARCMTREAWARWGASSANAKPKPPPKKTTTKKPIDVPTLADEVLDALGAERVR